jgi:hypothetical protein
MKILISIISTQKYLESRINIIKDTWLQDTENYVIISDYNDTSLNTVKVTEDTTYESNVIKNFESFKHFYNNYSDFDWFLNLDDDTFLNYKNLKSLINSLSVEDIFMLGRINYGTLPDDLSLNYCSGGAGYLFNRKTLEILKDIDMTYNKSRFADANVGFYCRDNNIPIIDNDLFHQREPSYYGSDENKIKKSITFHYIFNDEFYKLYKIINN